MGKKKQPPPEMPEYVGIKDFELDNSGETLAESRKILDLSVFCVL